MSNVFGDIITDAVNSVVSTVTSDDYRDADGILHCGKCGYPKETRQKMPEALRSKFGEYKTLPILCKCEVERQESERLAIEDAERAERIARNRTACFPYPELAKMTLEADDRQNPGMSKLCARFVSRIEEFEKQGAGLLFFGAVGGGKTFYAAAIANAAIDQGKTALFTSLSTLGARMSANFGNDRLKVLTEICRYDLLVLDDLGIERSTDAMNENVYQIVNALYSSKSLVIFTTNLSASAMTAETDPNRQRIYSRIFEMTQPVEVKGDDRRRTQSEAKAALYKSLAE